MHDTIFFNKSNATKPQAPLRPPTRPTQPLHHHSRGYPDPQHQNIQYLLVRRCSIQNVQHMVTYVGTLPI